MADNHTTACGTMSINVALGLTVASGVAFLAALFMHLRIYGGDAGGADPLRFFWVSSGAITACAFAAGAILLAIPLIMRSQIEVRAGPTCGWLVLFLFMLALIGAAPFGGFGLIMMLVMLLIAGPVGLIGVGVLVSLINAISQWRRRRKREHDKAPSSR